MTHRTDRVYLPPDEERCTAMANECRDKTGCARYMAPIPVNGKLADYSLQRSVYVPFCAYYRRPAPFEPQVVKVEVKPWPHD